MGLIAVLAVMRKALRMVSMLSTILCMYWLMLRKIGIRLRDMYLLLLPERSDALRRYRAIRSYDLNLHKKPKDWDVLLR